MQIRTLFESDVTRDIAPVVYFHEQDPAQLAQLCILELIPQGDFLTYGVGVSLLQMREPAQAQARVPVGVEPTAP